MFSKQIMNLPFVDTTTAEYREQQKDKPNYAQMIEDARKEMEKRAAAEARHEAIYGEMYKPPFPSEPLFNFNPGHYRDKSLQAVTASSMEPEIIEEVLPDWLPKNVHTLLSGASAIGKSQILASVVARATNGGSHPSWPDASPSMCGHVIFISSEDDFASVILPRLVAAGANLEKVHFITGVRRNSHDVDTLGLGQEDIKRLSDFKQSIGSVALMIFEIATMAIHGDSRNNQNVQTGFAKLDELAKRFNCAIISIAPSTRYSKGKDPLSRLAGPRAVTTAPRSIWLAVKIEAGPTDEGATHILVRSKASAAKLEGGYLYSIEGVDITRSDGAIINTSRIVWRGYIPGDPADIVKRAESGKMAAKTVNSIGDALNCIRDILRNGHIISTEFNRKVAEAGITTRDRDQAKKILELAHFKLKGEGKASPWAWCLPGDEPT